MTNGSIPSTKSVQVTAKIGLNVRSSPGVKSNNKIGAVPDGTVLQATGKTQKVGSSVWEQVNVNPSGKAKTAWVDGSWLAKVNAAPTANLGQYLTTAPGSSLTPLKTTLTSFPSPTGKGGLPSSVPYFRWINEAAAKYGVDPALVAGVIKQESGFNPSAVSPAGAIGLGQLMPGTAQSLGVNPWDPQANIDGTAHYLAEQLRTFRGNASLAIAAYNAGPGAVEQYNGVPPYAQTQNYVQVVLANYGYFHGIEGAPTAIYA